MKTWAPFVIARNRVPSRMSIWAGRVGEGHRPGRHRQNASEPDAEGLMTSQVVMQAHPPRRPSPRKKKSPADTGLS